MRRRITSLLLLLATTSACLTACSQDDWDFGGPSPEEEVIGFMTEGELDRIVMETSARMLGSSFVQQTDRALRVAPPVWVNSANVPVERPAEFVDRFTERVNGRTGAAIQFQRRPWAASQPVEAPILGSADFLSRLTLAPAPDERPDKRLRLRLEVFRVDSGRPEFSDEQEFAVEGVMVAEARGRERRRQEQLEAAATPRTTARDELGEVRLGDDRLSTRLVLSERTARILPDGRIEVAWRVTAKRTTDLRIQATYFNAGGEQTEVSRLVKRTLRKNRRLSLRFRSQLPADRYAILIESE